MEPTQQAPQPPVQQPNQTAEGFYDKTRKRSFLFSRVTVVTSMLVLVVVLAVNISVLSSQNRNDTRSRASEPENTRTLPSLSPGCHYQPTKGGFTVVCPTATPIATHSAAFPINIIIPKLPPQCEIQTTTSGTKIVCANQHDPIPTVAVSLPSSCKTTNQTNAVQCTVNQKSIATPLPSLPAGCEYVKLQTKYFVHCDSQEKLPEKRGD